MQHPVSGPTGWREAGPEGPAEWRVIVATLCSMFQHMVLQKEESAGKCGYDGESGF